MIYAIKLIAFYLLFAPALWLGVGGDLIVPDRDKIGTMSLVKSLIIILVVGGVLGLICWAVWLNITPS